MSWISHCAARIGSVALLGTIACLPIVASADAQAAPSVWFENQRLAFTHAVSLKSEIAVALHDPALQSLLTHVGASVAWQPGERYVLVTTAEPRIVSFAVGDPRYDVGDVSSVAAFAPYEKNGDVYLPLYALAHALYLEPKNDRGQMVLQPQIAVAELQSQRDVAQLVLHGALPLNPKKISSANGRIVYDFPGLGSTLERTRMIRSGALSEIDVDMGGTTRDPDTRITLVLAAGANAANGSSGNYHDFTIALSGNGRGRAAPPPPPSSMGQITPPTPGPAPGELAPLASPTPVSSLSPVAVTAIDAVQNGDGFDIAVSVNGSASYEWHRLLDNRWYVDIHDATLQAPSGDTPETVPSVTSLRVHQLASGTVRIALSLTGDKPIDIEPSNRGLSIRVGDADGSILARTGAGRIGAGAVSYTAPSPAATSPSGWKYGPPADAPPAANPRLIVLDPGHGGSDPGAVRSAVVEKIVNLDISKRLRDILVARGWQVSMTHESDRDVYAPNDSARDELQARCDVANNARARLFVSVHANTAGSSGVSGTTFYFSKPIDVALAQAVERRVMALSGTTNDGVQKAKFYVTVHTTMPAILIETAFMTNPGDYDRLMSPDWRQRIAQGIADGIGDYASPATSSSGGLGQNNARHL